MMKREYAAVAALLILISTSIWNLRKVDRLTSEIGIALCKSRTASEQLNFKKSGSYLDEGLQLWLENEKYTNIFFPQTIVDETSLAFFQLKEAICREDITAFAASYETANYYLDALRDSEHPSLRSIF